MKYCPNCGTAAEDTQAYCINCGCKIPNKVANVNTVNQKPTTEAASDAQNTEDQEICNQMNDPQNSSNRTAESQNANSPISTPPKPRDDSRKKLTTGIGIGFLAAIIGIALIAGIGKSLDKGADTPKTEPSSSEVSEKTEEKAADEPHSLKHGIIEGANSFVYNGELVFFCLDNSIWTALIADDGSLYDFEETAELPYPAESVAISGTELVAGTSEGVYKADLNDSDSEIGKLEKILDNDIDTFSIYENYLYYGYGYTLYRISLQGESKLEVADEISDYQVTTQGIFYAGKDDGTLYRAEFDGTEKESLLTTPYELYLSAGKDTIYCRHDGSQEITMYTVSSDKLETITLPSWQGKYSNIMTLFETDSGLVYGGKDQKAFCYDFSAKREQQIGIDFKIPPIDAALSGSYFYWVTEDEIHWCNSETGHSDSFKPAGTENNQDQTPPAQSSQADTDGTTLISGKTTIETDLFTVKVPESWSGKVCYQIFRRDYNEYTLDFYHVASRNAGMDGFLFAISLYMDGTPLDFPDYEELGRLIYRPAEVYNVVATHPTDVQFPQECQQEYTAIRNDADSVISSFTVNSTYQFIPK